jgi:hypothetical protein
LLLAAMVGAVLMGKKKIHWTTNTQFSILNSQFSILIAQNLILNIHNA